MIGLFGYATSLFAPRAVLQFFFFDVPISIIVPFSYCVDSISLAATIGALFGIVLLLAIVLTRLFFVGHSILP